MDHTAPPPYSETDIFSNTNTTILTPSTSIADNASRVGRVRSDTSSTQDSIIYTPPYTPTDTPTEPDHHHPSNSSTYDSAQDYFNSRPAPAHSPSPITEHTISLTPQSAPNDIPFFPITTISTDITFQDWSTFLNFLLPDHATSINNDVAERKLQIELIDERMHRLTLCDNDLESVNMSHVDAQLDPLRRPSGSSGHGHGVSWDEHVNHIIGVWNEGFFVPRGVKIVRAEAGYPRRENGSEEHIPEQRGFRTRGRSGIFGNHHRNHNDRFRGGFQMGSMIANNDGFKLLGREGQGLTADSRGLRIGKSFLADHNGLRIGNFVADGQGVSFGGRRVGGGRGAWDMNANVQRGGGRGRGRDCNRGRSYERYRGGWRRRGGGRSHSLSSSSSSSSSSSTDSSDSEASIGSLPEYNNLPDQQLPLAKETLVAWLNHPEYPFTKGSVQKLKQDLKFAHADFSPDGKRSEQDVKVLRKEVKDLLRKFKDEKKSQKKVRKILLREKRELKKELRRDMKKERKEMKKEKKMMKKNGYAKSSLKMGPPMVPNIPIPTQPRIPTPPIFTKGTFFTQAPHSSTALHGSWPFAPALAQAAGNKLGFSKSAEKMHKRAEEILGQARRKEEEAKGIREGVLVVGVGRGMDNQMREQILEGVVRVEERAGGLRREGERLLAEAVFLDGELARELQGEE